MQQRTINIAAAVSLLIAAGAGFYAYRHSEGYLLRLATSPGDPRARSDAIGELYDLKDPDRVAPVLIGLLDDKEIMVRAGAAQRLGWMGRKDAVDPLIAALRKQSADDRTYFIVALGAIGDARAIGPLVALLDLADDKYEVDNIVAALVKLGPDMVQAVIPRLSSSRPQIRGAAAHALGSFANEADTQQQRQALAPAVDALISMLRDPVIAVKTTAADAMGAIRDPKFLAPLIGALGERDDTTREVLARVISYYGEAAIVPLTSALQSTNLQIKGGAAEAFAALNGVGDYALADRTKPFVLQAGSILDEAFGRKDLVVVAGGFAYYLKQGKSEAVTVLADAMRVNGSRRMANALMSCGEETLEAAARTWAVAHGFTIESVRGKSEYQWGRR